jgi:hypothetical protein
MRPCAVSTSTPQSKARTQTDVSQQARRSGSLRTYRGTQRGPVLTTTTLHLVNEPSQRGKRAWMYRTRASVMTARIGHVRQVEPNLSTHRSPRTMVLAHRPQQRPVLREHPKIRPFLLRIPGELVRSHG